jgi:hypothetical protein
MDRTVDVSGWATRAFQYALIGSVAFGLLFLVALAVWRGIATLGGTVPHPTSPVWSVTFATVWGVLTVAWVRHLRAIDGNPWASVPGGWGPGRLAGDAGLTRYSWARSIRGFSAGETSERGSDGDSAEERDGETEGESDGREWRS